MVYNGERCPHSHSETGRAMLWTGAAIRAARTADRMRRQGASTVNHLDIIQSALGALAHRRSFTPGIFESLAPLIGRLGYGTAAVYITDDYPDRMNLAARFGGNGDGGGNGDAYPATIALGRERPLRAETAAVFGDRPDVMVEPLFSHGCELGVLVASAPRGGGEDAREGFKTLAGAVSTMAYIERLRTTTLREREERDMFFAQSLVSRLLVQDVPKIKHLRIGCKHVRSLEAGGDFFDFVAKPDGSLLGFVGSCSGSGLRTVLEVCGIMREIHRSLHKFDRPSRVLERINTLLVEEKRRRHQASLCLFHVSAVEGKIRLAKSGRLGVLLCGPGRETENISAPGEAFLGMAPGLEFRDEAYAFRPGQSLFCVTEGFFTPVGEAGDSDEEARLAAFTRCVGEAHGARRKKPLANAVFELAERTGERGEMGGDTPMLALSVEFLNNRESVRIIRGGF